MAWGLHTSHTAAALPNPPRPAPPPRPPPPRSARYRGHGTDLAKVPQFQRHGNDSGSPEVQIARMSARVLQLTEHLAEHKKDYSTRRGLLAVLSQRKQMLLYLQVRRCWAGWAGWRPAGGQLGAEWVPSAGCRGTKAWNKPALHCGEPGGGAGRDIACTERGRLRPPSKPLASLCCISPSCIFLLPPCPPACLPQRTDRAKYTAILAELNIRPLKVEATARG